MKIITKGPIKPYYVQTLAMLFFPGESFSEAEEQDGRTAEVSLVINEDGAAAHVSVTERGRTEIGDSFLSHGSVPDAKVSNIVVGSAFYDACVKLTTYMPPWGTLTGVRPAKLAEELLSYGMSCGEARDFFVKYYRTSEKKAHLAVECAVTASKVPLPAYTGRECSVYVAIPFCPTRCSYCSFVSCTSPKLLSLIPEYLTALSDDIARTEKLIRELGMKISTVYIGGGTPTVLDEEQLSFLLNRLDPLTDGVREFTLEAGRPDTITTEKMKIAASHGVTRVSVNTQTLNDDILASIGRRHTAEDFFRAYECADYSGIPSINVDLIAGLPGESSESFSSSLDRVLSLHPGNITVHTFCVKKSSRLKTDGEDVFDREGFEAAASVDYSQSTLMGAGYIPYYMYRQKNTVGNLENVGYSLPNHEGLYNILMMDELESIFACGASAVTKLVSRDRKQIERIFEPKYPYEYLREHAEGGRATEREREAVEFFKKNGSPNSDKEKNIK